VDNSGGRLLQPLTYHRELVDFLKAKEPELWSWMSAAQIASQSTAMRNELLRSTYRVDSEAHPEIVGPALAAAKALGVSVPISVYQSEGESSPNAALIFVPDEAIVLLSGSIVELLTPAELTAIMGHELAHFVLWTTDHGDHLVADRLVNAVANDSFDDAFIETSRLLALSTELFADRGALLACADLHTAVSSLVKVSTGMRSISAASYLRQAEELLAADSSATNRVTHPETVLRSAALEDFATGTDDLSAALVKAMYGSDSVDRLDVLGQQRMERRTRNLIDGLLQLDWFRTEPVLAHMRAYFSHGDLLPRYPMTESSNDQTVGNGENLHDSDDEATKKFLCYVLLDFATVDPDLMPASIVETAVLAHTLGFGNEYESTVKSELRLKKKELLTVFAEVAKRTAPRKIQRSGAPTSQDAVLNGASGEAPGEAPDEAPGDSAEPIDTKGDAQ
jgi:Zn-dependent protease with chaperone function